MTDKDKRPAGEPPLWGWATVTRDEDTGELFWKCEIDMEECDTETPIIKLAAATFKEGTIVRIYEPASR